MGKSFVELQVIVSKIAQSLRQPLACPPLTKEFGAEDLSEIIHWAVERKRSVEAAADFMRACVRRTTTGAFSIAELRNVVRLWRDRGNPWVETEIVVDLLNETYAHDPSAHVWNGLALLPPEEWKTVEPHPGLELARFCSDDIRGFTREEVEFLVGFARERRKNFGTETKGMRHRTHILPSGKVENDRGDTIPTPSALTERMTPYHILALHRATDGTIRKAMKRLRCYSSTIPNLFVICQVLVNKESKELAIEELPTIGYDRSGIDIDEINRVIKETGVNGNSKKIGDAMVVIQNKLWGRTIPDAIRTVRRARLHTSSLATFFRLDHFLKHSAETIGFPGNGR